jgi:cytidylate kinase
VAILTISRQFGSGAEEIGEAVAESLGYGYIDRKTILEDMRKTGISWEERAKYFDENYPTLWERYDWSYRGFVAMTQSYILGYASKDNVVIIGRGANFLLKGVLHHFGVRIESPLETRIERIMERYGVNSENARWLIEKADSEMSAAVYLIYGRRWDDPVVYDRVFDSNLQPAEEIVKQVKQALQAKETMGTPQSRNIVELRRHAATIKAGILSDPSLSVSTIDVKPKEEGMREYGLILRAVTQNRDEVKRIEEVARALAGDLPIEFEVRYRWHPRFAHT